MASSRGVERRFLRSSRPNVYKISDSLLWRGGNDLKYTVSVFVTDAFGCIGSDTINAPYTNLPTANFTTDPSIITTLSTPITYNDA